MNSGRTDCRAVVIDPDKGTIALARSLLLDIRQFSVFGATDLESVWFLLQSTDPELVVIAHTPPGFCAPRIARELRMSELAARKAPIIMLAREPTEADIRDARDAGIDEVLRKPFTVKDLILRVDTALHKRRDWIEGIGYVGPDRRRFNAAEQQGRRRRRADKEALSPEHARIGQALKIMKTAIEAIDTDPRQALRALQTQADELQEAAVAITDFTLAGAAKTLRAYLQTAMESGRFNSKQMAADMNGIFAPSEAAAAAKKRVLWVR